MSNRRRKSIGQKKLRRNLLIRIARSGGKLPGDGSWRDEYRTAIPVLDEKGETIMHYENAAGVILKDYARIIRETEQLRAEVDELVMPYWREAA